MDGRGAALRRLIIVSLILLIMFFSVAVLAVAMSLEAKDVAGGQTEVKNVKIKVLSVSDVVSGNTLQRVIVRVVSDTSGDYRVSLTVGSWTGSQTVTLTANIPATLTFYPSGVSGSGFTHTVRVTPL